MINWGLLPVQLRTEVTYNSAIIFNFSFQNSLSSASKAYIGWNKSESVHWKHQLMDYQEQINTAPHPEKKTKKNQNHKKHNASPTVPKWSDYIYAHLPLHYHWLNFTAIHRSLWMSAWHAASCLTGKASAPKDLSQAVSCISYISRVMRSQIIATTFNNDRGNAHD